MDRTATVSSKSQVTLPAALRERLGIGPGDRIRFRDGPDGAVIVEKDVRSLDDLRGRVEMRGAYAQLDRWIAEGRSAMAKKGGA